MPCYQCQFYPGSPGEVEACLEAPGSSGQSTAQINNFKKRETEIKSDIEIKIELDEGTFDESNPSQSLQMPIKTIIPYTSTKDSISKENFKENFKKNI